MTGTITQKEKVANLENLLRNAKRLRQEFTFFYGTFYDIAKEHLPGEGCYDIVIYTDSEKISRAKESIEGIFVTSENLNLKHNEIPVRRNQMKEFEKEYSGIFVPNEKLNSADEGGK